MKRYFLRSVCILILVISFLSPITTKGWADALFLPEKESDKQSITDATTPLALETLSNIGGNSEAVVVIGNLAYVGEGQKIVVLDISNTSNPIKVGQTQIFPALVKDIAVYDNYLFVADNDAGLRIVDISTSTNPVEIGSIDTISPAVNITTSGNFAYVSLLNLGLWVFDISNPNLPINISHYYTTGYSIQDLEVIGDLVFIQEQSTVNGIDGLLDIVDFSSPTLPKSVGSISLSGKSIFIQGNYAFIVGFGFHVVDISNPTNPIIVSPGSAFDFCSNCGDVIVRGNYGYTIDVGADQYRRDGYTGLQIIDVSNPATPIQLVKVPINFGNDNDIAIVNNTLVIAREGFGVSLIDISKPTSPLTMGQYNGPGSPRKIDVGINFAYVADISGLRIYNVSNPQAPILVSKYDLSDNAAAVKVAGNYVYVICNRNPYGYGNNNLYIFNVSNPSSPILTGKSYLDDMPVSIDVVGEYAYIGSIGTTSYFSVYDISNPYNPGLLSQINLEAREISVKGSYAYIASRYNLVIVDISNPLHSVPIGWMDIQVGGYGVGHSIDVSGNYAYLGAQGLNNGLHIANVTNPTQPIQVGFIPGEVMGLDITNSKAFVLNFNGYQVLDVFFPNSPFRIDGIEADNNNAYYGGVNFKDGIIYKVDDQVGLVIIQYIGGNYIHGKISTTNNMPLPGVLVYDGLNHSSVTKYDGTYSLGGLPTGTYTITPQLNGYDFTPISRTLSLGSDDAGDVNFSGTIVDVIPPATIADLSIKPDNITGSVLLSWTAPGDDGTGSGNASQYDLRYSNSLITSLNWSSAIQVQNEPLPGAPSSQQQLIASLPTGTHWYVGIRTVDHHNNWSAISNIPSFQEIGFRPNPSGYNFANYGGNVPSDFTIDDMRRIYGDSVVCQSIKDGTCFPKLSAEEWNKNIVKQMEGGHCDGMATTSTRFFKGWDVQSQFQQGINTTYGLSLANIRKRIAYYWSLMYTDSVKTAFIQAFSQTPDQLLTTLQSSLSGQVSNPTTLVFYKCKPSNSYCTLGFLNKNAGHTITPYGLQEVSNGIWHIWVYDNNYPNDLTKFVEINTNAKTWKYDPLGWDGDANSFSLGAVPVLSYNEQALGECPWCKNNDIQGTQVWVNGDLALLVQDEYGRRFGYDGINTYTDIPGSSLFIPPASSNSTDSLVYYLPTSNSYTLQTLYSNVSPSNTITTFSQGYMMSVSDVSPQDLIIETANQITYNSNLPKLANLSLTSESSSFGYKISLGQLSVNANEPVSLKHDSVLSEFVISTQNSPDGFYWLNMIGINNGNVLVFSNNHIPISKYDTQYIDINKWDNETITIKIDSNSDGTIDKIVTYPNLTGNIFLPFVRRN